MRRIKWAPALVITALLIGACQQGTTGGQKPAKLTIAAVQGNEDAALKAVAPLYEQKTGIKIEIVEFPYDQLFEKLVTTFKANSPTYDLVMMDDPWMPKFGTDESLQPLDSSYGIKRDSDIPDVVYDVGTWPPPRGPVPPAAKGKPAHLIGVTIVGNVEMFMYRSDMGPAPKTWDEVKANADKNKKANLGLRRPRQGDEPDRCRLPADPVVVRRRRIRLQLERHDRQRGVAQSGEVPGAGPEGGSPTWVREHRRGGSLSSHGHRAGVPIHSLARRDHRDRRERDGLSGQGQGQLHPDAGRTQRKGHRHDGELAPRGPEGLTERTGSRGLHYVADIFGHAEDLR